MGVQNVKRNMNYHLLYYELRDRVHDLFDSIISFDITSLNNEW